MITSRALVLAGLLLLVATTGMAGFAAWRGPRHSAAPTDSGPSNVAKVDVDLFVMSQCPDAFDAEAALTPVLEPLRAYVTITLHFIGQQNETTGEWYCKHGPQECEGNLQQLCVQLHTKQYNRFDWLYRFVLCNNKAGREAVGKFTTAIPCLKEAGIPLAAAARMLACMASPARQATLARELAATAALGVRTSCTVQVDNATACVRDGGEWVEPCPAGSSTRELAAAVCKAYAGKNRGKLPSACQEAPALALPSS